MRELLATFIAEIRGFWRYRWAAIGVAWLVCLLGWAIVSAIPDTYESEAVVLFDTSSDLNELLESLTVSRDVLSHVEAMRTAMLGRQALAQVARETNLQRRAGNDVGIDRVIDRLRTNIAITTDEQRGGNIYHIKYRDPEPGMAKDVVETLLKNFVEGTLGANREGSRRTQEFLQAEIASLEQELTAAEQRLADFKRENVGRMPGESGDYFARLQAEMTALEASQSKLRQARRRQETLRQQLAGEQPALDGGGPTASLDKRIADNEKRLEDLQLRFTNLHPDVIAVKAALEQLSEQKAEALDELRNTEVTEIVSDNPVFQNIQIEIAKINVEIASLREQERTHQQKIAEYRQLVDVLPQVEAELARLNRDYDVTQAQYRALLQKLGVAELSDAAGESDYLKFQIIDPPREPDDSVAPNRPLLLAVVLLAGLSAGGGIAFVRNQLSPVFENARTITEVTGLPVIGTVQRIETRERRNQRRTEVGAFSGAVALLCAVFIVMLVFNDPASELVRSLLYGVTST